jgi:hypothetical protein
MIRRPSSPLLGERLKRWLGERRKRTPAALAFSKHQHSDGREGHYPPPNTWLQLSAGTVQSLQRPFLNAAGACVPTLYAATSRASTSALTRAYCLSSEVSGQRAGITIISQACECQRHPLRGRLSPSSRDMSFSTPKSTDLCERSICEVQHEAAFFDVFCQSRELGIE